MKFSFAAIFAIVAAVAVSANPSRAYCCYLSSGA